jgi:hypothetical protein
MVTKEKLMTSIHLAYNFIGKAEDAIDRLEADKLAKYGCKETGAVRRASMDLTRALVEIRK